MTDCHSPTADGIDDQPATASAHDGSADPRTLAEEAGVEIETLTFTHETADHPETGSAGLAVVGLTDSDGAVLFLVHPDEAHAVLPHAPVAPDGDWAAAAREHIAALAGLDVAIDGVRRVRRIEHVVPGDEARETTHHVVLAASVARAAPTPTGLCEDNDWEIGWYRTPPVDLDAAVDTAGEAAAHDDVRYFLD